jgi:FtsZ-interacting cell division protein ZipA
VIEFNDQPVGDTHGFSGSPSSTKRSGVTVMQGHAVDVPGASVAAEASESVVSGDATTIVEANPPQSYQSTRPAKILLDWPPEKERRLVSVRVVAQRPDGAAADAAVEARLSGALIRQALAAEGFWYGKFDIFHMPLPDGRVVLSAAGLTQPGTFDLTTMDSQRFVGLSIFGVLPGPLPDTVTFEELVAVARQVAARLGADLQDSRGAPLTSTRVMDLRATFVATDAPATAGGER